MFWDLNGTTDIPRFTRQRQIAATVTLFPTWDAEPITNRDMPVLICGIPDHKKQGYMVHSGTFSFIALSGQVSPKISLFRPNTSLFLPAMPSNK